MMLSRSWRYEQELASLLWKVDMKDVAVFRTTPVPQYGSSLNLSRVSVRAHRITVCIVAPTGAGTTSVVDTTNFSNLSNFNKTVSSAYLLTFCKVNLARL